MSESMIERVARAMAENAGFCWQNCAQSQWKSDAIAGIKAMRESTAEMVEKVARAIALSEGARFVSPGQSEATRIFGWKGDGEHFEKYADENWQRYITAAQFAINAMRGQDDS